MTDYLSKELLSSTIGGMRFYGIVNWITGEVGYEVWAGDHVDYFGSFEEAAAYYKGENINGDKYR